MLEIAGLDSELWRRSLETPGGFAWWYADLTSEQGDGLVLIWAWGLPFLAGSRIPRPARSRPVVNVCVYRGTRPDFYLLQEYVEQAGQSSDPHGAARLGRSHFRLTKSEGRLLLQADLDEPLPGGRERLTGRVEIEGPEVRLDAASSGAHHVWTPRISHGRGQARLRFGKTSWELSGAGYFDGNASSLPLQAQGISSWRWGRVSFEDESFIFYDVTGERADSWVLEAQRDGSCVRREEVRLEFTKNRRGLYGVWAPREVRLHSPERELRCVARALVDDGPFYQRFLLEVKDGSRSGHGVFEVVAAERVDRPWQRPFVRMRTHHVGSANSIWLPLFWGSRRGRVSRLLNSWGWTRGRERVSSEGQR